MAFQINHPPSNKPLSLENLCLKESLLNPEIDRKFKLAQKNNLVPKNFLSSDFFRKYAQIIDPQKSIQPFERAPHIRIFNPENLNIFFSEKAIFENPDTQNFLALIDKSVLAKSNVPTATSFALCTLSNYWNNQDLEAKFYSSCHMDEESKQIAIIFAEFLKTGKNIEELMNHYDHIYTRGFFPTMLLLLYARQNLSLLKTFMNHPRVENYFNAFDGYYWGEIINHISTKNRIFNKLSLYLFSKRGYRNIFKSNFLEPIAEKVNVFSRQYLGANYWRTPSFKGFIFYCGLGLLAEVTYFAKYPTIILPAAGLKKVFNSGKHWFFTINLSYNL